MTHRTALAFVPLLFAALSLALLPAGAFADDGPATAEKPKVEGKQADAEKPAKKGEVERRPLLWLVEGTPRVFLYGTIHVADPRVTKHLPVVQQALDQSTALYTELRLDMAGQAQMQMEVMQKAALPAGKTLKELFGDELYARVEKVMPAQAPLSFVSGFKPWFIQFLLMQTLMQEHQAKMRRDAAKTETPEGKQEEDESEQPAAPAQPLDPLLYGDAQKAGKQVGGLETIGTQLAVFDALSYETQVKMVTQLVDEIEKVRAQAKKDADAAKEKDGEGEDAEDEDAEDEDSHVNALTQLIDMWLAGNDQGFLDVFERDLRKTGGDEADSFVKGLLDDRNAGMVKKILELMKADPKQTYFIAVGAGHMPGVKGMVRLLERAGFKVRRLELGDEVPPLPKRVEPKKEPAPVK